MDKGYWKVGYYQKSAYQRSFVSSAIIVYAPLLVLILILPLFLSFELPETQSFILFKDSPGVGESGTIGGNSSVRKGSPHSILADSKQHSRFVVGSRFEIIRETSPIQPAVYSQKSLLYEPFVDFAVAGDFSPIGNGGEGFADIDSDMQFGLPWGSPYLPMPRGVGKGVIYPDLPATVRLASPIWPDAAHKSDTGFVQLLLLVNEEGYISWEILEVTPGGYGFRPAVESALLKGKYYPAERNGRKVSTTIMMTVIICRDCNPEVTTQNGNVSASLLKDHNGS